MKFYRRHGALVIESKWIVALSGLLMAGKKGFHDAKAAAFVPFVFVRKEEYATPIFINHERIHFKQQLETLFIGSWLLHLYEDVRSRIFLKLKAPDYYLYRAIEQEAYRNQHDMDYLKKRPLFNVFKYVRDKRKLSFVGGNAPEVIVGESWSQSSQEYTK